MAEEIKKYDMTLPALEIDAALLAAKNAVSYEPQTPTPEQQAQAKANLGLGDGVCLPVVEFTTEPTAENAMLTSEELQSVLSVGYSPFVVKFALSILGDSTKLAAVANCVYNSSAQETEELMYTFRIPGIFADFAIVVVRSESGEHNGYFMCTEDSTGTVS